MHRHALCFSFKIGPKNFMTHIFLAKKYKIMHRRILCAFSKSTRKECLRHDSFNKLHFMLLQKALEKHAWGMIHLTSFTSTKCALNHTVYDKDNSHILFKITQLHNYTSMQMQIYFQHSIRGFSLSTIWMSRGHKERESIGNIMKQGHYICIKTMYKIKQQVPFSYHFEDT